MSDSLVLHISSVRASDNTNFLCVHPLDAQRQVQVCKPQSFSACLIESSEAYSKDFWRELYTALKDEATVTVRNSKVDESILKMTGFVDLNTQDTTIEFRKPQFKSAGTQLRKKAQESTNPWGNLSDNKVELINESDLMANTNEVAAKFCGENDRIMPGKPCENCTCGKKELLESAQGQQKLETGQVESDCGKCYLGDAFRCASCPYLGQPAFEKGDKVKLQNASVGQMQQKQEASGVQIKGDKVVLEL